MISRRLLRIKALMCLYAWNCRDDGDLARAENELMMSIKKSYELYIYILQLILEIADIAEEKINLGLNKKIPTFEDLNPNRRFIDNKVIGQLRGNRYLKKYRESHNISWQALNPGTPRILYNQMVNWDQYMDYMNSEKTGYSEDKKYLIKMLSGFFLASEDLASAFEEQSIYWNDDLEHIILMAEKTLRKVKPGSGADVPLMPLFKNEDDESFVMHLFRRSVIDSARNIDLIDRNTTNWEVERIALMDTLVMQLAITEIVEFKEIPVKVTLNEYIEIAKDYCTSKSSKFVNGILDKIVKEMREKNLFVKTGRGLLGENQ